jgi:hypothetical protein
MREFPSGFHRDSAAGKPRYTLIPRTSLRRVADHYTAGAEAYGADNWRKAETRGELLEFQDCAFRHLIAWLSGERELDGEGSDVTEDHGAAVVWNVMCGMDLEERLDAELVSNVDALRRAVAADDAVPEGMFVVMAEGGAVLTPAGAQRFEALEKDAESRAVAATLDDMDEAARHAHRHSFSYQDGATSQRLPSGVILWTCACGEATYNERAGF